MNKIIAKVTDIQNEQNLNIVEFTHESLKLYMMSLELEHIQIGSKVVLVIKPTHLAVSKNLQGFVSFSNRFDSIIQKIEIGKLLCSIELLCGDIELQSVITKKSALKMALKVGDEVTLLAKASELSIVEVLDE